MAVKMKTLAAVTIASAGTRVAISATDIRATSVIISAPLANTGVIYVGDESVDSTNGIELSAGQSVSITPEEIGGHSEEVSLSDIYVDAASNGDKARIQYIGRR